MKILISNCGENCPFCHIPNIDGFIRPYYCWLEDEDRREDITSYFYNRTRPKWCQLLKNEITIK